MCFPHTASFLRQRQQSSSSATKIVLCTLGLSCKLKFFETILPRLRNFFVCCTTNRDRCTPYICVMTLLDSRVGRILFRNHRKTQCGKLLYTASMNYWGQCPLPSCSTSLKRKCFWGAVPRNFISGTHFILAINATNALLGDSKMMQICRQKLKFWLICQQNF